MYLIGMTTMLKAVDTHLSDPESHLEWLPRLRDGQLRWKPSSVDKKHCSARNIVENRIT